MREHRLAVVIAVGRWVFLVMAGLAVFMTLRSGSTHQGRELGQLGETYAEAANPFLMFGIYVLLSLVATFWLYCVACGGEKDP